MLLWVPAAGAVVFAPTTASPYWVSIPGGGHPAAVAAADFNGDGRRDLVVVVQQACADFVSVMLGSGDGGFSPAAGSPLALGGYVCDEYNEPDTVAVADFNGDGRPDLAVTTLDALHVLLLGDGSGGFTLASEWLPPGAWPAWPNPNFPSSVAAADLNGDGRVDLAVGTDQGVGILLGDGSGNFAEAHFYAGGSYAHRGVTLADFNGDGKPDLAVTNYADDNVSVLLGDGGGGFTPASGSPFPVGSHPVAVTAADFSGDGHFDLAVPYRSNSAPGGVSVLLGDGSGGFSEASGSPLAVTAPSAIEAADVNKDGHPDLVAASGGIGVSVLLGDGSGGFTPASGSPLPLGTAMASNSVAVADFNGDGAPDIATSFSAAINAGGVFVFLSVPPDTSISAGPAARTRSTSAAFSFTSSDSSGVFQCKLDSAAWTPCTAPITYSGLSVGTHVFDVRATNDLGKTDPTPAEETWTVDRSTPPVAELQVTPDQVLTGHKVSLSASGSHDPFDGTIVDYKWDLGSGRFAHDTGSRPTIKKSYARPGLKTVRVKVTNEIGGTATARATANVRPRRPVGLSIDDGDYASNSTNVRLYLGWPAFATRALISNDGGFSLAGATKTSRIAATIPWKLESGTERLPKTVYLRFPDSTNPTQTYTDDIILDTTTPLIQSATLTGAARTTAGLHRRIYRVRLRATEKRSGISLVRFSHRRGGGTKITLRSPKRRGIVRLSRVVQVRMTGQPTWVRVRSAAGNWSKWHPIG